MSLLWTKDKMWFDEHNVEQVSRILQKGFRIGEDGQLRPVNQSASYDIPWVFVGDPLPHHCGIWNEIYFQQFKLIPRWCRTKCHKVVVSVPNVAALMDLHGIMQYLHTAHGLNGKLGTDLRTYTWGFWRGFFYNVSMELGLQCLQIVREEVGKHIPGATVILKKGCTEMERTSMGGYPSNEWGEPSPADIDREDHLEDMFHQGEDHYKQPPWLRQRIMLSWWLRAYSIGDSSLWSFLDRQTFEQAISAVRSITYEPQPAAEPSEKGGDPA